MSERDAFGQIEDAVRAVRSCSSFVTGAVARVGLQPEIVNAQSPARTKQTVRFVKD